MSSKVLRQIMHIIGHDVRAARLPIDMITAVIAPLDRWREAKRLTEVARLWANDVGTEEAEEELLLCADQQELLWERLSTSEQEIASRELL